MFSEKRWKILKKITNNLAPKSVIQPDIVTEVGWVFWRNDVNFQLLKCVSILFR